MNRSGGPSRLAWAVAAVVLAAGVTAALLAWRAGRPVPVGTAPAVTEFDVELARQLPGRWVVRESEKEFDFRADGTFSAARRRGPLPASAWRGTWRTADGRLVLTVAETDDDGEATGRVGLTVGGVKSRAGQILRVTLYPPANPPYLLERAAANQ